MQWVLTDANEKEIKNCKESRCRHGGREVHSTRQFRTVLCLEVAVVFAFFAMQSSIHTAYLFLRDVNIYRDTL